MAINPRTESRELPSPRRPIGDLLREVGRLSEHDVKRITTVQRQKGGLFGDVARKLGLVNEQDVQRALAKQFNYPYVDEADSLLSTSLAAAYRPFGPTSEALRQLRSELCLRWLTGERKTIAICGARRGVGCSSLAANLAISFAQLEKRTLLVGADLRHPKQHELFSVTHSGGLAEMLAGHCLVDEALVNPRPFDHLYVLCSAVVPPNPHELLSQASFHWMLELARERFDVILVDSPPVLEFPDAQVIAARTGGCLLVTKQNETRLADIEAVTNVLAPTGAQMIGAVIQR